MRIFSGLVNRGRNAGKTGEVGRVLLGGVVVWLADPHQAELLGAAFAAVVAAGVAIAIDAHAILAVQVQGALAGGAGIGIVLAGPAGAGLAHRASLAAGAGEVTAPLDAGLARVALDRGRAVVGHRTAGGWHALGLALAAGGAHRARAALVV